MRGFADTAYVHAKIYGLRSMLLSARDYSALLDGADLGSFFPGLARPQPENCTQLEQELFRRSIRGVLALAQAAPAYEPVFKAFLLFFEIRNVKLLLARAAGAAAVDGPWCDIAPYATFSRTDLDRVRGWDDFFALIRNTYLEDVAGGRARPRFEAIESRLDRRCLDLLTAAAESRATPERLAIRETVLMRCVLLKTLWAWRLARYYGWQQRHIEQHLALFAPASPAPSDEAGALRARSFAVHLENMLQEAGSVAAGEDQFEQSAENAFFVYARSLFGRDVHSGACVAGYLWLLYCQIRNLFLLLEAARFGLPRSTAGQELICEA